MSKSIVTDFGADPTFASDSTAALTAAAACATDQVFWDVGKYKISAPIPFKTPGYHYGAPGMSIVCTTSASDDQFQVQTSGLGLRGLTFQSAVPRTGGAAINVLDGTSFLTVEDYRMDGAFIGVLLSPFAGAGMAILVTAFALFTDSLRDALDPKLNA